MKLTPIHCGRFKLDGGAMFGVVPKRLWQKKHPADRNNLCVWAMRALLIETEDRKILVDTGMGEKQDAKFRSHFEPHGHENLYDGLRALGLATADITDVLLTHLHFDHVGGAVERTPTGDLIPAFPRATYWVHRQQYDHALAPNEKEAASFLPENYVPLLEKGVLQFFEGDEQRFAWLPGIELELTHGHTPAMLKVRIQIPGGPLVIYCADALPSTFHLSIPWVMAYDIEPLKTLDEKKALLEEAATKDVVLFFEHDPDTEAARITKDERGRYRATKKGRLAELIS